MSELIILVGLMGCGKTTLAKKLEKQGYNYIDFDRDYHYGIQKELPSNNPEDIVKFLEELSKILNRYGDESFVCDNWFKWHINWWRDEEDNTLQRLKEKLKFHEIKLVYMSIPLNKAYEGYLKKNKAGNLIKSENYKNTIELRCKNLNKKVSKWAIQ